jgi:AcrR family transcriptional regulator
VGRVREGSLITRRPSPSRTASRAAARGSDSRAHVSEVQRARMLACAARVIAEHGYEQMSVARVTHGARVSRRTFYDVFADREDCFLAVFDDALEHVGARVLHARQGTDEREWHERVRAGLQALLASFDEDPQLARLLVIDALRGGPRVLERRAEVLARVSREIQESGSQAYEGREPLSPLTGEGVAGGVLAVIHTRLSSRRPGALLGLLNPLMAVIVLPYQGPAAARRELQGSAPVPARGRVRAGAGRNGARTSPMPMKDPLADLPMRLTYRTLCVLEAIADRPGASNRTVADLAGIGDQGQVSKLLGRLQRLGLVANAGHRRQPTGEPNVWRLTALGERVTRQLSLGTRSQEDGRA